MGNQNQEPVLQELEHLRQRNRELEQQLADAHAMLNSSSQSYILIGPDYTIRFFNHQANQTAQSSLGRGIVFGQSILDYVLEEDIANFKSNFTQALAGRSVSEEKQFRGYGQEYWFWAGFNPVTDQAGKITAVCLNTFDITARKMAEQNIFESEQKFISLFDISPDAILLADAATGLIVDANAAAGKLFKRPIQEIRGMHQKDLHPPDAWEKAQTTFAFRPPTVEMDAPPVEIDIITAQNHRKTVEIRGRCFQINGREFVLGNFRDITERKQAEDALKESQANLLAILESTDDLLCSRDRDGKLVYFNPAFAKIVRRLFKIEATIGLKTMDYLPENERRKWDEILTDVLSGNQYRGEFEWDFGDGDLRYYEITFIPIRKDNAIIGSVELNRDITNYKLSERALRASETRFRQILENSLSGAYSRNLVTDNYDYLSPAFARLTGYSEEALRSMPIQTYLAHVHPEDVSGVVEMAENAKPTQNRPFYCEYRFRHRDGEYRWFADLLNVFSDAQGVPLFVYGDVRDITDRKRMEAALKNQEQQLVQILNTSPNLIGVKDANGKYFLANRALAAFFHSKPEDLIGKSERDFFDLGVLPKELNFFIEDEPEIIATGVTKSIPSQRFTLPDGTVKYFKIEKVPFELPNRAKAVLLVATEITELVEFEHRLQESEFLLKEAQKIAHIGHWIWDLPKQELVWSDEIFNIFGYTRENFTVSAENFEKTIHPDDLEDFIRQRETGLASEDAVSIMHRIIRSDGEIRFVQETARIIRDAGKPQKVFGTVQDITERKNLEDQLLQSQKMEAIGKLAGGIAHDFNNLLTVINGYSEILLSDMPGNLPQYQDLLQIKRAGLRAASLTHQLLAFSRKQVLKLEILNMNELLTNLAPMLRRLIGEDIELTTCLAQDLANIKADRGQMEQIIINLAANARDAMPTGGKLLIRSQNVAPDESRQPILPSESGPMILISISDTGSGMDDFTLAHIFDPFFTTKEVGKGTGLGLSTVYGIVKQSGGNVHVESKPDRGATFYIYLPAFACPVAFDHPNPAYSQIQAGTETILVVEDEKSVLNLVQRTLKKCGYRLITATDGIEALEVIKKYEKPIHLLLTDVVMPNLSGKELSEKIIELHPGTKICFMSGYTNEAIVQHGILNSGVNFIQKPFSPELLVKRVREILDAHELTD